MGKIATKYADEGKLVPDEVTNKMVKDRINEQDCENGFILDGYPRTLAQAKELDKMLEEKNTKVDLVINLNTPTEEIIERVLARRECPKCKRVYNMVLNKPKEGELEPIMVSKKFYDLYIKAALEDTFPANPANPNEYGDNELINPTTGATAVFSFYAISASLLLSMLK